MCRKIIWAPKAEKACLSILDFWIEHDDSSAYSLKIVAAIEATKERISEYPFINPIVYETPLKEIRRVVILYNFSLFYGVFPDKIEAAFFFGNRDNPKKPPF